jgi:hypothetical protein
MPKVSLHWSCRFQELGLEKGWGDTAERCKETLNFLSEVLQAPDPINMEKFFSRVPSIFNIVVFSIHGYFGQEKVLGLPDTGGQVSISSNIRKMVLWSGYHTLKAWLLCNRSSTS